MSLLLLFYGGGSEVGAVAAPDAGGADGPDEKKKKKPKPQGAYPHERRIYSPEELVPHKSVEQQLEEYFAAKNAPKAPARVKRALKKAARSEPLTQAERDAVAYWELQASIDDEEDEIIMLLMAA
jgi:hypothetical protein